MFRFKASFACACGIALAVCAACGDDGSASAPVGTAGTGVQAGTTATAAGTSGGVAGGAAGRSAAGRGAAGVGPSAGRSAAGSSAAGSSAAGRGSAGSGAQDDDDAGVKPGTGGTGAAGAAGSAGAAAGSGGASGGAAGAGAGAGGAAGSGMGAGATFTEVYAIFQQSCAGAMCHVMATRPGEGLSMSDKMTAYMNLVGVNAGACSGEKRVVAGDPAKSELLHTLERTQIGMCRNTPRMPEGKPMLAADQIAKVRSWIQAGALNN